MKLLGGLLLVLAGCATTNNKIGDCAIPANMTADGYKLVTCGAAFDDMADIQCIYAKTLGGTAVELLTVESRDCGPYQFNNKSVLIR